MKPRTEVKARVVLLVLFIILSVTFFALVISKHAEAKEITVGTIEFKITAFNVCNSLENGDTVKIYSDGGMVLEAMEIAACVRKKDVIVKVVKASSAATFIVLAGHRVCFSNLVAIGFHSPYSFSKKGLMVMAGINELRDYSRYVGNKMYGWGYTNLEIYSILGVTMATPSNDMKFITYNDATTILGDRFIGECKQ